MNYRRQYNDEDIDMCHTMQLANREINSILSYAFIDPKTIKYEIPPRTFDIFVKNKAVETFLNLKLMKKQWKQF